MYLIKTTGRLTVRLKKSVRIIGIAEDIDSRAITGDELILPVV